MSAMKSSRIERARNYLAKMPVAVSGQCGHITAFKAVCAAAIGFDLTEDESLAALADWNAACQPPWRERELQHKIASARRDSKSPPGYLLGDDDLSFKSPAAPTQKPANETPEKRRLRWPAFYPLSAKEIESIARLRQLGGNRFTTYAVRQLHNLGYLSRAQVLGHTCFILNDGTFAQARRFDSQPFTLPDGRNVKAWNLPGSQGQFVGHGCGWLGGPEVRVLLVEGAIALLEALAAYNHVGPDSGWTIVAATSAYSRFEKDVALQQALAGRQVRIIPDNEPDGAGYKAAADWLIELEALGCGVEVRALPEGIKDLGPLVADPSQHSQTLHALFQ
jgi:hypothetical protein